jgi:hypothetical protein
MATALIQVKRAADGKIEARLVLDWDGRSTPEPDARVSIGAIPPPPPDCENWITFLLKTAGPSAALHTLGGQLHDLLMSGDIGAKLKQARAAGSVRVLLKAEPPLDALPWELMRSGSILTFTNVSMPVARVAPSFNPDLELPKMCWPLRVMLVVASNDPQIQGDDEIRYIKDAFRRVYGLVDLEVCRLPDRDAIRKLVEAMHPHVFHFIGHGGWNDESGGYLRLGQKGGAPDIPWTAGAIHDDLAFAVKDDPDSSDQVFGAPRLAVLNACQSGQPNEHRGTLAAAEGLAELNVPAVIAMQGPVRGRVAARFAKGLYEQLSIGWPLDRAVTRARVEITDEFPPSQRDYALPTLILGAPPERILDLSRCDPSQRLAGEPREKVLSFVDRLKRRRQLWDGLWTDQQVGPRIFAITGPDKAGKGSLVRWCLGVASVLGHRTVLMELEDLVDSIGFLDQLIQKARGDAEFYAALADLRVALIEYEYEKEQADRDGGYARSPLHLYEELTRVLTELAAERPLLIGIDGLAAVERGEWEPYAVRGLVAPIALGHAGRVRLVASLQERDLRFPPRHFKQADIAEIPIKLFPQDDFVELATQRLRAMGYLHESFNAWVNDQRPDIKQDWGTETFDMVDTKATQAKWEREWQP